MKTHATDPCLERIEVGARIGPGAPVTTGTADRSPVWWAEPCIIGGGVDEPEVPN